MRVITKTAVILSAISVLGVTAAGCNSNVSVSIKDEQTETVQEETWRVCYEKTTYDEEMGYEINYEFDEDGRLTESVKTDLAGNEMEYVVYDQKERVLMRRRINDEGMVEIIMNGYDSDGNLVSIYVTDEDDNPISEDTYLYNENGDITYITKCTFGDEELCQVAFRYYDENGNLTSGESFINNELDYSFEEEYDSEGRLLKTTFHTEKDMTDGITVYEYQPGREKAVKSTLTRYAPGNVVLSVDIEEYDEEGRIIRTISSTDDITVCEETYKFDEAGHEIEYVCKDEYGTNKHKSVWDTNGNKVKEVYYYGFWPTKRITRKYDDEGKLMQTTIKKYSKFKIDKSVVKNTYDSEGRILSEGVPESLFGSEMYNYRYDEFGNIVRKAHIQSGREVEVKEYRYVNSDN